MTEARTFRIQSPFMRGDDISYWQRTLIRVGRRWGFELPIKVDGIYGMATRSFSKMILFGSGFTHEQIDHGITPWVRTLLREPEERTREMNMLKYEERRSNYRDRLRRKFAEDDPDVAAPIGKIITMTWGYHPGVHDGIDLICGKNAPIYAICDARVIDVRAGGWWGKAPSGDVRRGDGIIQLQCLTDDGPFRRGMHIGYGHAEHATVDVGQKVEAGKTIGRAGLAVAWHVHFMANHGRTMKGIGEFNPRPLIDYALKHSRR